MMEWIHPTSRCAECGAGKLGGDGCDEVFYELGGLALEMRQDVAVGVQGEADAGVAESLLNDLGMDALLQHERGRRVAQIMESDLGQASPLEQGLETSVQIPGVNRGAQGGWENEIVLSPVIASERGHVSQLGAVAAQDVQGTRADGDDAAAGCAPDP